MSVVGPRPLLVKYLPLYNEHQARRHDKSIHSKRCDVYDYVDGEIVQVGSIFSLSGYLSLYTKDTEDYVATRINTHSIYFTCIEDNKAGYTCRTCFYSSVSGGCYSCDLIMDHAAKAEMENRNQEYIPQVFCLARSGDIFRRDSWMYVSAS